MTDYASLSAYGPEPWPAWVRGFRDHQVAAVEEILDGYRRGKKVMVLDAPVGCLSGETLIPVNRGGKGYRCRLDQLVRSFHGGTNRGRVWDLRIPTRVQRAEGDRIRLGILAEAYYSGVKVTYALSSGAGRSIRATLDHRFLTPEGWKELRDLASGDLIAANVGQGGSIHQPKAVYRYVSFLPHHPFARWSGPKNGHRVLKHRLVAEAAMNDIEYEDFVAAIKRGDIGRFEFIDPDRHAVHHIDHDPLNNDLSNLEVLTHSEHHRRHARDGKVNHVLERVGWDEVHGIVKWGAEPTFDLAMADDPHNFIANEFVVHNSGKTLIAEMVRRRMVVEGLDGADGSMLYVAHSRGLQDQFLADFPTARVLKGKSNYPTVDGPPWVNCGDCTATRGKTVCRWCPEVASCPYRVAKQQAKAARVAVVNTAYMLAEAQTPGAVCSKRTFICVDECDTLEGILSGAVEFGVRERDMAGLGELKKGVHGKTIASWVRDDWLAAAKDEVSRIPVDGGGDVKVARRRAALVQRMSNAVRAAAGIEEGGWVRDYSYGWGLMLKPVQVDWCGQDRVWRHGQRWLLMSGTVIDAETMCGGLGLERGEWEVVEVPMTFARENRLVRVAPVADMSRKALDAGWDREMGALRDALWVVLERHAGENVLVHTVSYKLNGEVVDVVRDWAETRAVVHPGEGRVKVWTYQQAADRDAVLERFKDEGGVMVGPSLDRGVDLPGDLCRVQVLVKIPFPNLGDRQVAERARGDGGGRWYAAETARTLVQMTGRGVRGADDWCVSYVFDKQFMRWWKGEGKRLLPRWWRDGMVVELVREYQ